MADPMQQARELLAHAVLSIYPDDTSTRYVLRQLEKGDLDLISARAAMRAIAAALRDVPEDLAERHAVAELDAFRLAQIAKEHRDGRLSALERVAELEAKLRAAPEGYVLVPVEPTEEMIEASLIRIPIAKRINPGQHLRIYGARAWDAMLAARPQGVKP